FQRYRRGLVPTSFHWSLVSPLLLQSHDLRHGVVESLLAVHLGAQFYLLPFSRSLLLSDSDGYGWSH
ncbi:hypothetical protein, partial [Plesiomonas shigelloides]|uniref:hypothetical protein n=1 Tax=Plesiomonas shigelloides TaxID=703 RepID=UPI001E3E7524